MPTDDKSADDGDGCRPGCLGLAAGFYLWCWVLHWLFGTPVPWPW